MILKRENISHSWLTYLLTAAKRRKVVIFLSILGLGLYSGIMFVAGAQAIRKGYARLIREMVTGDYNKIPLYYIKGLWASPRRMAIHIKHKNLQRLEYTRELALLDSDGIGRTGNPFEYVSAAIEFEGQVVPIRMRLKGDRIVHFSDRDKYSYRIQVKGENTLWGMKRFSIQKPRARNYIHEWLFHQVLRREGLIALRYMFVDVTLNGRDLGIYAVEEHFGKHLVENNQQREGPVLQFSEDFGTEFGISPIKPYEAKKWSTPEYIGQTNKAVSLLEAFRAGKMKVSEVFDTQKLAVYFAVTDLLSVPHGAISKSMKFYYNPVTSKLEPIGFDGHFKASSYSGEPYIALECAIAPIALAIKLGLPQYNDPWLRRLFSVAEDFDESFFREYVRALERVSRRTYLDDLFADLNDDLESNLALIYRDSPVLEDNIFSYGADLFTFSREVFYRKQDYIRGLLNLSKSVHIYQSKTVNEGLLLSLSNIQMFPLEIANATYRDSLILMPNERIILRPNPDFSTNPNSYQYVNFELPRELAWSDSMASDLVVNCRILGTNIVMAEPVYIWTLTGIDAATADLMRQRPNVHEFPFLDVDDSTRCIYFKKGTYDVGRSIIIPAGYKVFATEGLELNLRHAASILSYSPLLFRGSEQNPIYIQSPDSTGQGVIVINADSYSLFEHVHFKNLASPSHDGWELTGAVTFFESHVKIVHSVFSQNRSEDALNVFRSNFEIDDVLFRGTRSDAFDGDFVNGRISNSSFISCGNDAIDVSGSIVDLENLVINGVGDKGLSIGENSRMTANRIVIGNAELAVVSKDLSTAEIEDIYLFNSKVGFTVFQKKPEFGPASMAVVDLETRDTEVPHLVETKSILTMNGREIAGERDGVEEMLYGQEYGKSSK